ncbi:hypothetical protein D3C72_2466500 [compost metagenome]
MQLLAAVGRKPDDRRQRPQGIDMIVERSFSSRQFGGKKPAAIDLAGPDLKACLSPVLEFGPIKQVSDGGN